MPRYRFERVDKRISPEEARAIINSILLDDIKAIVSLLYLTGARVSEVLALTPYSARIDKTEVEISIPNLKLRGDKKQKYGAFVPSRTLVFNRTGKTKWFMDHVIRHINRCRKLETKKLFEFNRFKVWYELKKASEIVSPHSFRHSRLQTLADKGATQHQIRAFAGHSRMESSTAYIEGSREQTQKVKEMIE